MILLAGLVSNHRFEDDRTGYVGTLISVNEYKVKDNCLIVFIERMITVHEEIYSLCGITDF